MRTTIFMALIALLTSACASLPPAPGGSTVADITPQDALAPGALGKTVRWGGNILETRPEATRTCFEVIGRPLGDAGRPQETDKSYGRFIACAPGFYDPAAYGKNRLVTFVGTVEKPTQGKVGEYRYTFPRLAANSVKLWPPQRNMARDNYYDDPFWNPFWGPWPYSRWPYYW